MASVVVDVPDDIFVRLQSSGQEPGKALQLAAAFSLCKQGLLATSQAARLAGLCYADFLAAAALAKIELFPIDIEELKEQIDFGQTLGRQCVSSDSP